jgi:acetylornithine deacetylase
VSARGSLAPGDARALSAALVQIDSRNPALAAGAPGEARCVALLHETLDAWGFRTEVHEAAPGRPNLIARIGHARSGAALVFCGHSDVVGTEGMTHAPFAAEVRDGRLYGRGAADMKGGLAAMCAGAWRAANAGLAGELVLAITADVEHASLGARTMLARGVRADAAIVAEPTGLAAMPAHRGFAWIEVTVRGRAAHGSRYELGVDAIRNAGLLLAELDRVERTTLARRTHPLLGRASLHASTIEGGTGMSTYPDRCVVRLERRTLPGEPGEAAVDEVRRAIGAVRADHPELEADVALMMSQEPSDVAVDAPVVRALEASLRESGEPVRIAGMSAWTDAALLNAAGIPAICFGPGDISLAHAAEEYIPLEEIDRAVSVLAALARRWCG